MTVRFEMDGAIGVATLADPARRNALSRAIVRGLFSALDQARACRARALVITGEGTAFCAGANISDLRDGWMQGDNANEDPMHLFEALTQFPRIVLAAVNGPAVGGGFELSLSCDLVVADQAAWFALPELAHGVVANTALARLAPAVGLRRALDLMLRGRRVSAAEAFSIGLASEVVETDSRARAVALAREIVERAPPGALAVAKRHAYGHAATDWARVRSSLVEVPQAEWQEGLQSFIDKRPANYEQFWSGNGSVDESTAD
jgi:enoyl-CoA hydratase/carnithine racemase